MQPRDVVIVSACRTAIGKFQGQFKDVSARDLAITAGKEAIRRAGIDINTIDEMVMGECYLGMQGSLPARQVSMRIGLPVESSAVTVNQSCASGMRAMEIACHNIMLGKTDIGLVVGVENMTQAPFLLPKARMGYRMGGIPTEGGAELYDSLIHDALYDALVPGHMGVTADNVAKLCNVSRQECDELADWLLTAFAASLKGIRNERGGIFRAGTGSAMYYVWHADHLGATADGRRKGERLPANFSPSLMLSQRQMTRP